MLSMISPALDRATKIVDEEKEDSDDILFQSQTEGKTFITTLL